MEKYFDALRKCPLFDGIADENIAGLLVCLGAKTAKYGKKETIIAEGAKAVHVGILLSGSAQITQIDCFGNRSIVADIRCSELFGESFACAGVESVPVDVIAAEDCEVVTIAHDRVLSPCAKGCEFHRRIIYNLMKIIANKNLAFHRKISITSKRTTREKLMAYLAYQAKSSKSNSFTVPFDRQELADYLEVDRSGLSAEISKLRRENIIRCERNRFTLLI